MKANVFPGSEKHHVNLLCRLSYEPVWFFTSSFSSFSLLFTGQGWVSPKGIPGSSRCPSVPHISPPCPLVPVEKKCMGGGQKGALLIPGIPVHLASVDVKSRADYFQSNPNQAGLLSILCPLFFLTAVPIFLRHFCHSKAS